MSGIDRVTGKPLTGFAHVRQSFGVIFRTPPGTRVLARDFGLPWHSIIGKLARRRAVLRFWTLVAILTSIEEPRFPIRRFLPGDNDVEKFRAGGVAFIMEGEYRPRAHLGDRTVVSVRQVGFADSGDGLKIVEL